MRRLFIIMLLALFAQHSYAKGDAAPAFTLANAEGEEIHLPRSHDGVDIYFFWASWCPYCKALMPHLQSMRIEYGDNVTVYALNIRDDEDPELFMAKHDYDFVLLPEADPIMALYGVKPTPAVFLVDGEGIIRFNLYDKIFDDSQAFKAMSHGKKAVRRAPYWAADIRQTIDQVLNESEHD